MEEQAVHVVGEVGQRDLGFGTLDADGADEQAHDRLLMREHVLDAGADLRLGGVAAPDILGHRLAPGLPAVDATDPALRLEPFLVALAAIGGIGPDVRGGVVLGHHVAQHPPIKARAVSSLALADEAEGAADRDAALVAEAGYRNVGLLPAIGSGPGLGELQRPARVREKIPQATAMPAR